MAETHGLASVLEAIVMGPKMTGRSAEDEYVRPIAEGVSLVPTYVYLCEANGASVEVIHPMSVSIETWGELCERAECDPGDTPADSAVQRQIFAPAVHSVQGPADLKNLGFQKLVRRDSGVYEDVTATDKASRIIDNNIDG